MTTLEERISNLEGSFDQLDKRVSDLTDSVNQLCADMNALRADMNAKFNTLIIVMATGGVAVVGAIITLAFRG